MIVLITSDTHRQRELVEAWKSIEADLYIHCGDSELAADDKVWDGVHVVKGNCDVGPYPLEKVVEAGETNILVVHGHKDQVKRSMLPLSYKAEERGAHIACFGHSHLYGAEYTEGRLFINPGSLAAPRGGRPPTYAQLIITDETYEVAFYTLSGDCVDRVKWKK